jgi:superfamily II DNA or RNA helicase
MHEYGAKRREPVKILILAHREELISQISESIGKKYGIAHGKIKSRHDEEHHYPTQIASVQTLYRRIERWIRKDFDIIIIDEAHHVLAKTYRDICNKFPNAKILGVTATPYRLNAEPFPPMFDILVQSKSIYQFIKDGYLCEYEYYSIKPQSSTQQMINSISVDFSGDYDEQEMINYLDNKKVRANIIETYETYAKGKKGIVYTINKVHNLHVYEIFKDYGYATALIDSDTPVDKRKEIVQQFKAGGITILCNVNIFSEGFDCPDVEFIQLARPTLSLAMYLQQIGRGFRIHEEKEKVIFLDNVGLFNRFGLPSSNRKWQYYFEGKHKGIEFNHSDDSQTNKKVKTISEGSEEVELLYDSSKEQAEPYELFWESGKIGSTQTAQVIEEMEMKELKTTTFKITPRINKNVADTFVRQRKFILDESKNILDPQQAKISGDISIIETLRISKKKTDVYRSIVTLSAYTFRLIKSKDSMKVERVYKAKDILTACALYQQSDCSPAFLESVALEHRNNALKNVADSITRVEKNITILTKTLTDLGNESKVYEVYLEKLQLAQSSLTNKVSLLQLAKNM